MVEGDGLENRCAVLPRRGFESHPLRQTNKERAVRHSGSFFLHLHATCILCHPAHQAPISPFDRYERVRKLISE